MFGCIAHVINQVAYGKLDQSFLPDLSAFSLWDDLICPLGLGIGITIVTWGPAIVIGVVFVFGVMSGRVRPRLQQTSTVRPFESEEMQTLTDSQCRSQKGRSRKQKTESAAPWLSDGPGDAKITGAPWESASRYEGHLELPSHGAGALAFFLLSVAWAIFYYPMALTVAGYTESFGSVINPLVGLDTIRG